MMGREWKPGDVAMLKCRDGQERVAMLTDRGDLSPLWIAHAEDWGRLSDDVPVRPLVVLDPENDDDLVALGIAINKVTGTAHRAAEIHDALRSLITPPRPDEPKGLGAVVEDENGDLWVRVQRSGVAGAWQHMEIERNYAAIKAVKVLSEGVS